MNAMRKTILGFAAAAALLLPWGRAGRTFAVEWDIPGKLAVNGATVFMSSAVWHGMAAPDVSAPGSGVIYFDSSLNIFRFSEDGGTFSKFQTRVSGNCSGGYGIRKIYGDGTVECEAQTVTAGIIFLSTGSCPAGFQELSSFAGRFPMGTPPGGTVGGTVGSPLADLAPMTHTHPFTPAGGVSAPVFTGTPGTTASESGHSHSFTPAGSVSASFSGTQAATPSGGDHTHATGGPDSTYNVQNLYCDIRYPASSGHTHTTGSASALHTHTLTAAGMVSASFAGSGGTSAAGTAHSHGFTPAGTASAPSFTGNAGATGSPDASLPYIQVRFCLKP